MSETTTANQPSLRNPIIRGAHAILGVDIVLFSTLHDDDQIQAIENLLRWIKEALSFHGITEDDYRWSPAGDGGYLTLGSPTACRKAIDVAFSIAQKTQLPDWRPRTGEKLRLRLALHAGNVQEARELGQNTNIWGMGINMAARILSVAASSQLLVSKQYFDTYISGQRENEFTLGDPHWRTVKHGVQVEVMNADRYELCLGDDQAKDQRWQAVGGLWRKTIREYRFLIHDTMKSGEPIAALAAAKFLLDLGERETVRELCQMIGSADRRPSAPYPHQTHPLFSLMPPAVLFRVIEGATPHLIEADSIVCRRGDPAESCFFPVSGSLVVDVPGQNKPIRMTPGQIIGEFNLWIPNITRTATVRVIDEGMLLKFDNALFEQILNEAPFVAQSVHNIIKTRIIENVLSSRKLFPLDSEDPEEEFSSIQATCEKYEKGTILDLTSSVYILFNGRVKLDPPDSGPLTLVANGNFGTEKVVGIISDIGSPDGSKATVLEESVAVRLSHAIVQELQRFDSIGAAWSALYGERLRAIRNEALARTDAQHLAAKEQK